MPDKPPVPIKVEDIHLLEPIEKIAADVLGPLPMTKQDNKYILVGQDYFSKWIEAKAVANCETEVIVNRVKSKILVRHGVP